MCGFDRGDIDSVVGVVHAAATADVGSVAATPLASAGISGVVPPGPVSASGGALGVVVISGTSGAYHLG